MKESFVFHFEYIEDIPEELQPQYAMYVINYARYGEEPILEDWRDKKIWNRIKSRMDDDTDRYSKKCNNLRNHRKTLNQNKILQESIDEAAAEETADEAKQELPEYTNEAEEKPKGKRFKKPTPEEVQAYCDERKNGIDGEYFCSYYQAREWFLSKGNKMKDWKAAVRTWEGNRKEWNKNKNVEQQRTLPEDRNML